MSDRDVHDKQALEEAGRPPGLAPSQEPPADGARRETEWTAGQTTESRDMTPALGAPGGPASWTREHEGAGVALARPEFGDAQWSYLYKRGDTAYAAAPADAGALAAANRRMRSAPVPEIQGPFIKGPVWTWEVPLYFWVGGVASGSAFVALACDAAGDRRSAAIVRKVALGTVMPAPLLLIADLGRPGRFLNMLRIVKPRSPMNTGAWCLMAFSVSATGAVASDLLRRRNLASALGGLTAVLGGYLGSYTGVLLASTAVPVWARSRTLLGPIFVSTATATGAAASRLVLQGCGLPRRHPTSHALRILETAAIFSELVLSTVNERRLGPLSRPLRRGRSGLIFRIAEGSVLLGLAAQAAARFGIEAADNAASALYLAGGLAFRYGWVEAGKASADDHEAAAAMGRRRSEPEQQLAVGGDARTESRERQPVRFPVGRRWWAELVRRVSLGAERRLRG